MSETIYYEDPLIQVTSYGVKSSKGMYPLSELRGVYISSSRWINYLMIAMGSTNVLIALDSLIMRSSYQYLVVILVWSLLIPFQIYGLLKRKHVFYLNLQTAQSNKNMLSSVDESYVQEVAEVIKTAQADLLHPFMPPIEQLYYRGEEKQV